MRNIFIITAFLLIGFSLEAQIDAGSLMGIPTATTTEMNNITGANVGGCLYNTDENALYYYTGSVWTRATDDQTASEVDSDTPVDVDGDGNTEATVEDVIQDIAPITSKAARIFYPPSIAIDASSTGTDSVDLYQEYIDQFGSPVVSSEATAIPTYGRTELAYYVTYADPSVFGNGTSVQNMSINTNGVLSYEIFNPPADYNSLINVVFVVK